MKKATPKKKKATDDILVHCGKCLTQFIRPKSQLGNTEICGICLSENPLVEGEVTSTKTNGSKTV